MAPERRSLTPEIVALAESKVGIIHPVISVIDKHLPTISNLNEGYDLLTDNQEQHRYIASHYGFLADAIVEALPFTLEPTDLISIWSQAVEVFSGYHRYVLAAMLINAYAIQGLENPEWKLFPRHYLETVQLPEGVLKDVNGLLHIREKTKEISTSVEEINSYVDSKKDETLTLRELIENFRNGFFGVPYVNSILREIGVKNT